MVRGQADGTLLLSPLQNPHPETTKGLRGRQLMRSGRLLSKGTPDIAIKLWEKTRGIVVSLQAIWRREQREDIRIKVLQTSKLFNPNGYVHLLDRVLSTLDLQDPVPLPPQQPKRAGFGKLTIREIPFLPEFKEMGSAFTAEEKQSVAERLYPFPRLSWRC